MRRGCIITASGLGVLVLLVAAAVVDGNVLAPRRGHERFVESWVERLRSVEAADDLPPEWDGVVYRRRFVDGWILAAMHHGSCAESGGGDGFNACVFRDSLGHVEVDADSSPCAGTLMAMGEIWEAATPADSLRDYRDRYVTASWRGERQDAGRGD
ncbi:MAG: hypothetical protein KDK99_11200 [Verrucomicrobiales bacterium]|nr:hypothetical protein [Verrucomicrobiales bacterium]